MVNNQNTNLASSTGKLHMSDMGLHRTGVTGPTGYHAAQNPGGYGPQQAPTRRLSMNEMYKMSMDGRGILPQKGSHLSSSGGIPVQPGQPVQQVQPVQRPPVPLGALQYHPHPQVTLGGHPHPQPHPQMVLPISSVAVNAPPTSSVMMTTPSTGPSGYYPPTATPQEAGYPVTPRVTIIPQQQPYPVPSTAGGRSGQGTFPSGPVSISGPTVLPKSVPPQVTTPSGMMVKGNPVPYEVSKGAQAIITRQTGQTGSPGGRSRVGKDGTSVLSKVRMSPMRQASLSRSGGGGGGGSRPRDVTSQAPVSAHYDQLPQQRPAATHNNMPSQQYPISYSGNPPLPQSSAAPMLVAHPSTKYTNVQLHQQYHQQYIQIEQQQQQRSPTTPYQPQNASTRPHYQEHTHQKQQQQHHQAPPPVAKKSPPKVANKSPPKHHQTLLSTHMNGSPHNPIAPTQSHDQLLSRAQSQLEPQRQHYQQPNNVASQSQSYGKSLPHNVVHVNNTSLKDCSHNLVPKPNQGPQFQPQSTQAYDTLPNGNDSLSNINLDALDMNGSLASVTDELDRFTEEMSRALEQFDSLLQPQNSKPLT